MSPRPLVGNLANIAYDQMAPVARDDADRGYPLLKFLDAYYLPLQQVDDIVRARDDGTPGWAVLFDADRCPTRCLPWLAMMAGVRLGTGMSEAEIRARIKERPNVHRCTPGALIAAAQFHLTGAKSVILRERYDPANPAVDSPGHFHIVTRTAETPDEGAVRRALLEQKDVGLLMHYTVIDGQDWQELIDTYPTWADVLSTYATWTDVIEDTP